MFQRCILPVQPPKLGFSCSPLQPLQAACQVYTRIHTDFVKAGEYLMVQQVSTSLEDSVSGFRSASKMGSMLSIFSKRVIASPSNHTLTFKPVDLEELLNLRSAHPLLEDGRNSRLPASEYQFCNPMAARISSTECSACSTVAPML